MNIFGFLCLLKTENTIFLVIDLLNNLTSQLFCFYEKYTQEMENLQR